VPETTTADLLFRPVTELAELVRSGEVSSRELVEASLERIEALDGEVNAFATLDADRALAAADAVSPGDERPFAGVPMAIKDLFTPVAGLRQTQGSNLFGDWVPDYDTGVTRRFKDAGFIIVGATAAPEFGILPVTEPTRFGPTRNPWNLDHTPGGSSGGSGAAVAAGMVPFAHASDGGGSIRIPASCNGLVGLKPSRGRISVAPELGDSFLTTNGVLTRTVDETARLLDVLAGYEVGDATWAPPPAEPFATAAGRDPGRLRIAVTTTPPLESEVDPAHLVVVAETVELLTSLGHEVEEFDIPADNELLLPLFTTLWATLTSTGLAFAEMITGRAATADDVEGLTWALNTIAHEQTSHDYAMAYMGLQAMGRAIISMLAPFDALLTPGLAKRPLAIGTIDPNGPNPLEIEFGKAAEFTPFTPVANLTGQPAISLPIAHGDDGLPARRPPGGRGAAAGALGADRGGAAVGRPPGAVGRLTLEQPDRVALGVGEEGDLPAVGNVDRSHLQLTAEFLHALQRRVEVVDVDIEGDVPVGAVRRGAEAARDAAVAVRLHGAVVGRAIDGLCLPAEELAVETLESVPVSPEHLEEHDWVGHGGASCCARPRLPQSPFRPARAPVASSLV